MIAGAVLGLQRAVVAVDDQLDQLVHEGLVAVEVGLLAEVGRQQEVQVPGRGVARDPRQEAVRAEQRLQVLGRLADARRRHADVLDDHRHAGGAHRREQALHALAHVPQHLDLARARA